MKKLFVTLFLLAIVVLVAPTAEAQRGFGNSVAIADGLVIVGEPANQANPGYVYVYRYQRGEWLEYRSFTAPDASDGDGFGTAIQADDALVLISAVNSEGGAIHLYQRADDGEWHEAGSILPTEGDAGDRFGSAIARDGERLVVGAPAADERWGGAYIFEVQDDDPATTPRRSATWTATAIGTCWSASSGAPSIPTTPASTTS